MHPAHNKRHLAFDVGLKRTGVAFASGGAQYAQAVSTLAVENGKHSVAELEKLIANWQPQVAVVGDPQSKDPHLNKAIRRLVHFLQSQKLTVIRVDETLTTVDANHRAGEQGISQKRKIELRDQIAACLILECYLSSLPDE